LQGNVELHFDLFFTAYFNGGWGEWVAMLWKYMIAASAGESVIVVGCMQQRGFLLVSSGNQGTPVLHLSLITPLRHCSPSLRHVSYPAPLLSAATGVRLSLQ